MRISTASSIKSLPLNVPEYQNEYVSRTLYSTYAASLKTASSISQSILYLPVPPNFSGTTCRRIIAHRLTTCVQEIGKRRWEKFSVRLEKWFCPWHACSTPGANEVIHTFISFLYDLLIVVYSVPGSYLPFPASAPVGCTL